METLRKKIIEKLRKIYDQYVKIVSKFEDVTLLLMRLVLAYGFYKPAITKLNNIHSFASWLARDLGMPFPVLNAYISGFTELTGVILLALGLANRLIAIPLIFIMILAVFTVHWSNGFAAGDDGFEIPLYYLLFLLLIISRGAGKISLDFIIEKYFSKK